MLAEAKRKDWPRANHERIGFDLLPDDTLNRADWEERAYTLAELDRVLRGWTVWHACPLCDSRWAHWGIRHGVALCDRCGCDKLIYVYVRDERPEARCTAFIPGGAKCGARKDAHTERVHHYVEVDHGETMGRHDVELRCPIDSISNTGSRHTWSPPTLLRLVRNDLWAHPYTLHMRSAK